MLRKMLISTVLGTLIATAMGAPADEVDYLTQIKPLLLEHCGDCHGTDLQESGYRVDRGGLLIRGGDHGTSIIAGKPAESMLIHVLQGTAKVPRMPLDLDPLSGEQIDLITKWIAQGAAFPESENSPIHQQRASDHWSFQPLTRPEPPNPKNKRWTRNAIDLFIMDRLETEGLMPSVEANRNTLIRRLYLDLLGIPPTISEVERFLSDSNPDAYERLVDNILSSPRYGERWGRHWLDLARYADSDGFTIDGAREIWKYREWVINALNHDMPFDQFTAEQMAGDLMAQPTTQQFIATGFHRNTLINQEGGTSDEQFRVEAVVDRVNTTSAIYLGLTTGCAQCHQHKFDPISQRDFYELFAIFNNCEDNNDAAGSGPKIKVPSDHQIQIGKQLQNELAEAEKPLADHDRKYIAGFNQWKEDLGKAEEVQWTRLDPAKWETAKGAVLNKIDEGQLLVDFSVPANDMYTVHYDLPLENITAIRLEPRAHKSLPSGGPGRAGNGNFVLTEFHAFLTLPTGEPQAIPISRAIADHSQAGYPVYHAIDGNDKSGWAINVKSGNPNVDREAIFFPKQPVLSSDKAQLTITLNHSINTNYLVGCFSLSVTAADPVLLEVPASIQQLAMKPEHTEEELQQLEAAYKQTDQKRTALAAAVEAIKAKLIAHEKSIPSTMILRELSKPRTTHIQIRGDYLRPGAVVQAGVPAVLPPLVKEQGSINRLDFGRWLTDKSNPLTARVTVNRYWQRFFGLGIVETENDFGVQGSTPEHPELLDWLACEFRDYPWSVKSLHRLIVTSATYRQVSSVSESLYNRDPQNRLLARQSRVRLEAESIRDSSIQSAGVLSTRIGGKGVYPPQPAGIYTLTQQKKSWPESQGEDRFCRGMYIYFWRSSPYPMMPTFDAPEANVTCTRRSRSNTPLQALTLANDRAFFEFAQILAEQILKSAGPTDSQRMVYAVQRTLSRTPTDFERSRLQDFLEKQRQWYQTHAEQAKIAAPPYIPPDNTVAEAAAWTAVARVLLNLDEFITRE